MCVKTNFVFLLRSRERKRWWWWIPCAVWWRSVEVFDATMPLNLEEENWKIINHTRWNETTTANILSRIKILYYAGLSGYRNVVRLPSYHCSCMRTIEHGRTNVNRFIFIISLLKFFINCKWSLKRERRPAHWQWGTEQHNECGSRKLIHTRRVVQRRPLLSVFRITSRRRVHSQIKNK